MNQERFSVALRWTALLTFVGLFVLPLLAQEVEPSPDLPKTVSEFWKYAISAITPLIVWGVRALVPKIPTVLLPVSTPFIGLLLGLGLKYLAGLNIPWIDMVEAGALAVFIRETFNQGVTKPLERAADK